MHVHVEMKRALQADVPPKDLFDLPVRETINRMRYIPEKDLSEITGIRDQVTEQIDGVIDLVREA
jgi:nitrogen fixation protein